jgi:ribose transport system ATP-binding protein
VSLTVLLLGDPSRGVDIAAKRDIHHQLHAAAGQGMALLVTSSDTTELLELCDEIHVLYRGRVVRRLTRREATESDIASAAGGHL